MTPPTPSVSELLNLVHLRIGQGVQILTHPNEPIEFRWRRDYGDEGLSDERPIRLASSLEAGLQSILDYEDEADAADGNTPTDP